MVRSYSIVTPPSENVKSSQASQAPCEDFNLVRNKGRSMWASIVTNQEAQSWLKAVASNIGSSLCSDVRRIAVEDEFNGQYRFEFSPKAEADEEKEFYWSNHGVATSARSPEVAATILGNYDLSLVNFEQDEGNTSLIIEMKPLPLLAVCSGCQFSPAEVKGLCEECRILTPDILTPDILTDITPAQLAARGFRKTADGFRIKANRIVQSFERLEEANAHFKQHAALIIEGAVYHPRSRYEVLNSFMSVIYTHQIPKTYQGLVNVGVGHYPHLSDESTLYSYHDGRHLTIFPQYEETCLDDSGIECWEVELQIESLADADYEKLISICHEFGTMTGQVGRLNGFRKGNITVLTPDEDTSWHLRNAAAGKIAGYTIIPPTSVITDGTVLHRQTMWRVSRNSPWETEMYHLPNTYEGPRTRHTLAHYKLNDHIIEACEIAGDITAGLRSAEIVATQLAKCELGWLVRGPARGLSSTMFEVRNSIGQHDNLVAEIEVHVDGCHLSMTDADHRCHFVAKNPLDDLWDCKGCGNKFCLNEGHMLDEYCDACHQGQRKAALEELITVMSIGRQALSHTSDEYLLIAVNETINLAKESLELNKGSIKSVF